MEIDENFNFECVCEMCQAPVDGELHTCPFAEEIHGNTEALCNCCAACCGDCADDI